MDSFSVWFEPAQACRKRGLIRGNVLYLGVAASGSRKEGQPADFGLALLGVCRTVRAPALLRRIRWVVLRFTAYGPSTAG